MASLRRPRSPTRRRDAADPAVQTLVDRWDELASRFTGRDPSVAASLGSAVEVNRDGLAGVMVLAPERSQAPYAQSARDTRS